jgi:hypothetical protein
MAKIPMNNLSPSNPGFINDLIMRIKLIYRLMGDKRVNPLLKVIPFAALVYFIFPLDLAFGPLDDAAVLGLAAYLFTELCPSAVVQEHMRALKMGAIHNTGDQKEDELVIDGEFVEKPDSK